MHNFIGERKNNVQFAHMMDFLLRLLTPIATLLVHRGVVFRDAAEVLKRAYMRAAEGQGAANDSALSVMTGLQRRDVARLRGQMPVRAERNHLARLIAQWQVRADMQDDSGGPRALPRRGPAPSFEALAQDIRKDVHPRAMLDVLVAAGTVAWNEDADTVELLQSSYQPAAGSIEQMHYLAENLGDHGMASVQNVLGREVPFFDRALHYDGLTAQDVAILERAFDKGQMDLLTALNAQAAELQAQSEGRGRYRVRFGGYGYHEEDTDQ